MALLSSRGLRYGDGTLPGLVVVVARSGKGLALSLICRSIFLETADVISKLRFQMWTFGCDSVGFDVGNG